MALTPIYQADNLHAPAYQLRFSWSAWPSKGAFPAEPHDDIFKQLNSLWKADGIRLLEKKWTSDLIQFTVSVTPKIAPVLLAARLKGRLQHALRQEQLDVNFSRKVSLRSLGASTTEAVEQYIRDQAGNERFVDPRVEQRFSEFTVNNPAVDLSVPTASNSGRYWYNLHLVLVTQRRLRTFDPECLAKIRDGCFLIAEKKEYLVSVLSVMPDHLHLALRGNISHSAEEVALAFLNNLAYRLGQVAYWQFGYYAGTFGEYDMYSVRGG